MSKDNSACFVFSAIDTIQSIEIGSAANNGTFLYQVNYAEYIYCSKFR